MPRDASAMRILMVLESIYPAPRGGGAEVQVRKLARGLRARGHRVTVLCPDSHAGMARVERVDGSAVCRLPYPRIRLLGGPWLWCVLLSFLLSRRRRYDVWHVHIAHFMGAATALAGAWVDKRVVVKISGWWELERGVFANRAWPLSALALRCYRHVDKWQAISTRIARALADRGIPADRIAAIPNGVNMHRFADIPRPSGDAARFLFIGRLVKEKGLEDLLHAFAGIGDRYPDARLTLVGAGYLMSQLEQMASTLGIGTKVNFLGHRDDIENLMAQHNVGVLPSRIEGLSNTLLETMAAGLPMIASRISGNEDFVTTGKNGWLFESGDRAQLAEVLHQAAALDKPSRDAMGDCARTVAGRKAGMDGVIDSLLALYRGPDPHDAAPRVALHGGH